MAAGLQGVQQRAEHAQRIAVIGAGWAGLAAAVEACRRGHQVTLYEMAPQPGGRARSLPPEPGGWPLDNGQHILIGAYHATLGLMQQVGVAPAAALLRLPLALVDPAGRGLRMPPGAPVPGFVRAVLGLQTWPLADRLAMLASAGRWALQRFRCPPELSVAELTHRLSPRVRHDLIEPLCVAALNTPAQDASAAVFLRVLRDALFSGPGSCDLLLPRQPLAALLPEPACQWLQTQGATLHFGQRVDSLQRLAKGWEVAGDWYDSVVLASSAAEAARLATPHAPGWAESAAGFAYEPIVTVYLRCPGARLQAPMTMLAVDAPQREPAQFAFDLGQISQEPARAGHFAFVVSGAAPWVARGLPVTQAAVLAQARSALHLPDAVAPSALTVLRSLAEKRATFRCTPGLPRPGAAIASGLMAAGDYVEGPYPATLEGAVRSGLAAAAALL
ncbi:MAG: hydroxysqualene dehydroxylase HpnE [Burkholderiales bacterium]